MVVETERVKVTYFVGSAHPFRCGLQQVSVVLAAVAQGMTDWVVGSERDPQAEEGELSHGRRRACALQQQATH